MIRMTKKGVYACDETAVWLDPSDGTCITEKGAKTVTVLNTGHEKARVTVILTARSDGKKLQPFVLLPKKRPIPNIINRFKVGCTCVGVGACGWTTDLRRNIWTKFSARRSSVARAY
ncbi:hypothetical protein niasHT_033197 [Heterodera trifolii]|uniref:Uncharacterized protein n=1 Tax=Heterodera trifolii TaxID=157864 RepID=A0ABD2HZS1_9BILA